MSETIISPSHVFQKTAHVSSFHDYKAMYHASIHDPDAFWDSIARDFYWLRSWTKVHEHDFLHDISIRWFIDGQTNLAYNALDFQIQKGRGDKIAILWEGNEPGVSRTFTYNEALAEVCRWANLLKARGLHKGDRVTLYMPMIPDLAFAMLACARLGLVHSIVFGGFSAESLADRIIDAQSDTILTSDGGFRGNKPIHLKDTVDEAIELCKKRGQHVRQCLVVRHVGAAVSCTIVEGRDEWVNEALAEQATTCPPVWMDSEDPLFILYTSGSTGKPKGVLHSTGGYMVYTATTFKYVFDYHDKDIFWCTADIGWITGHSYIVYGPLCNGATTLMFEGIPTYPDPGRFWDVVDKYKVTIFYTAPTAIRSLERFGDAPVLSRDLSSLRLLGSVGEPINPEAWLWYSRVIGKDRCPVVDTWWQTETGGILITTLPGAMHTKPGKAGLPMFGISPAIVNERGEILEGACEGILTLLEPWPSIMRTVYGQHPRFKETYFSMFPGKYFTGDGCLRDEEGYYRITGRVDDVINVSGHRLGTAEIESALNSHPKVVESAVVGYPHDIKGQGIYAYVTLLPDVAKQPALIKELKEHVRHVIGPIASPDLIHWADALPKTRSGKIMRRILRKIASDELSTLGDTSTLADPSVVETLIQTRPPLK